VTDTTDTERSGTLLRHEQDPEDNEYATPPKIWRPLSRAVGGFDLDTASGAESVPIAPNCYTAEDDGLAQPWYGWAFCNPPWASSDGSVKQDWLRKARREADRDAVDGVVVLLPVDTSAHWFHDHILSAPVVCFVGPGRIPFEGEDRNPSFPLLIAVYSDEVPSELVDTLDSLGAAVRGREVYQPTTQAALVPSADDGNSHGPHTDTDREVSQ